jgi:hypothetical protein
LIHCRSASAIVITDSIVSYSSMHTARSSYGIVRTSSAMF